MSWIKTVEKSLINDVFFRDTREMKILRKSRGLEKFHRSAALGVGEK